MSEYVLLAVHIYICGAFSANTFVCYFQAFSEGKMGWGGGGGGFESCPTSVLTFKSDLKCLCLNFDGKHVLSLFSRYTGGIYGNDYTSTQKRREIYDCRLISNFFSFVIH